MKNGWKVWVERQFARVNAMSLRERAFLFVSLLAGCMALADVLWLAPAQLTHTQLTQRFEKQNMELQRLRESLKTAAKPVDKNQTAHAEIAEISNRLLSVNQTIKDVAAPTVQATPLAQVLVQLLRRHEGLTLVATSAVAPEANAAQAAGVGYAAAAAAAAMPVGLTRQGVALTVSGPYAELTRYVQTLETALPYVRWGLMKLKSDKSPPELTLQLFLVGVAP